MTIKICTPMMARTHKNLPQVLEVMYVIQLQALIR